MTYAHSFARRFIDREMPCSLCKRQSNICGDGFGFPPSVRMILASTDHVAGSPECVSVTSAILPPVALIATLWGDFHRLTLGISILTPFVSKAAVAHVPKKTNPPVTQY